MNTYGYMVIKNKNNIPLHIVEFGHEIYHGFCVFNNSEHAQNFIKDKKEQIKRITLNEDLKNCKYDNNFIFNRFLLDRYTNSDFLFTKLSNNQIYLAR